MRCEYLTDHTYDHALPGWRVRMLLTITGEVPATAVRTPLSIALVLDRSGSMRGGRIVAAREAAAGFVRRLHPDDRASVVLFDDQVETLSEPVTAAEQGALLAHLAHVEVRGSTNLSGGWLRGRELASWRPVDGGVRRVLLLTDGHANAGITDREQLAAMCAAARAEGITTSAIGFGEGYDEDLLRAMADAGGGNLWHVERPDQAQLVFTEELAGLQSLSAQNLALTVAPGPQTAAMHVRHDYLTRPQGDGLRLELGDLYAREPRQLAVEFVVPDVPAADIAGDLTVAEVSLVADVLVDAGTIVHRTIRVPVMATLDAQGRTEPTIEQVFLRLEVARVRTDAARRAERGDVEGATDALRAMVQRLREQAADDPELAATAADLEMLAENLLLRAADRMADIKYLKQRAYNASRGKAMYDEGMARPIDPSRPPRPPRKPRPS
jgi:Ca-activated chloride channel family protein